MKKWLKLHSKRILLVIYVIIFVIYFVADYFNFPSGAGLEINNINTDLLGIIVPALTAVFVFCLSYILVEQWNIEKYNNMKIITYIQLLKVYENCKKEYRYFQGDMLDWLIQGIYSKNKPRVELARKLANVPFENENVIIQCATQGVISPKVLKEYYRVKNEFSNYCMEKVIFWGCPKEILHPSIDIVQLLDDAIANIKKEYDEVN